MKALAGLNEINLRSLFGGNKEKVKLDGTDFYAEKNNDSNIWFVYNKKLNPDRDVAMVTQLLNGEVMYNLPHSKKNFRANGIQKALSQIAVQLG